jgi:hypothetical protein
MIVMLDAMSLLPLFAMAIRVNHEQHEENQTSQKKNDHTGLITPKLPYKTPEVRVHVSLYTQVQVFASAEGDSSLLSSPSCGR